VSERNDSAAATGRSAQDRDEPVRDRQPDPRAASAAAGSTGAGEAARPAVPGEPEDPKPAESASATPQGDPSRDKVTPEGARTPDDADAATTAPAAAEGAAKEGSSGTAAAAEDAPDAGGTGTAERADGVKDAADEPGAGKPGPEAGAGASGESGAATTAAAARVTATERPEAPETGEEGDKPKVQRFDCAIPEQREAGLEAAVDAIRQGKLIVLPTDTVYGIGADAFTPSAVNALLAAKGRGRDMPVPVLVGTVRAANALVDDLGPYGQDLIDAFWPGPLTIIGHAGRSLRWDLGETKGTVALRMPLHSVALDLLKETGPMAVSSANRSGAPPATTIAEAEEQLGDSVAVYLDGGRCTQPIPSTIVDLTTPVPRVLRKGAVPVEKLKNIVGYVATDD